MLIHLAAFQSGEVKHTAGMCHFHGQLRRFLRIHALQKNCHQQCGNLIIGQSAIRHALHKKGDFFFCQLAAVSFFDDAIYKIHAGILPSD